MGERNWATGTIGVATSVAVGAGEEGPGAGVAATDGTAVLPGGVGETAATADPDADAPPDGDELAAAPNPSWPSLIGTAMPMASNPATTRSGRRFTGGRCIGGILPEPSRTEGRPVRAGGRGVGGFDDGGPDRIRTGDLQRDRLACWAATPRVRLRRVRRIAEGNGLVAGQSSPIRAQRSTTIGGKSIDTRP